MTNEQRAAVTLVRRALGRTRTAQIVLAIVVLGLAYLFTWNDSATTSGKILTVTMIGFFVLIAAVLLWVALFRSSPSRSPLVQTLTERPDNVLRVYEQPVRVDVNGIEAPTSTTNVMVQLADGSTSALTVKKALAQSVIQAIRTLAPRAAVGPTA